MPMSLFFMSGWSIERFAIGGRLRIIAHTNNKKGRKMKTIQYQWMALLMGLVLLGSTVGLSAQNERPRERRAPAGEARERGQEQGERMAQFQMAQLLRMNDQQLNRLEAAIQRVRAMSDDEKNAMRQQIREQARSQRESASEGREEARERWMETDPDERRRIGAAMRQLSEEERRALRRELADLEPEERQKRLREMAARQKRSESE